MIKVILQVIGYILLGLVILLIILLNHPAKIRLGYIGKKMIIEVKFLFLTLYPRKKKGTETEEIEFDDFDDSGEIDFADEKDEEPPALTDNIQVTEETTDTSQTALTVTEQAEDETAEPPEELPVPVQESTSVSTDNDKKSSKKDKGSGKKDSRKPEKGSKKDKKADENPHLADKIIAFAEDFGKKKDGVVLLIDLIWADSVKFLKKVYFTGLMIDFEVANDDCAKAAVTYGAVSTCVYNTVGFLMSIARKFTVKSVDIDCLYNTASENSRFDGEITVRFRPQSLLNLLYALIFKYLFHTKKYKPVIDLVLGK